MKSEVYLDIYFPPLSITSFMRLALPEKLEADSNSGFDAHSVLIKYADSESVQYYTMC